jgi:hypothetical protein
MKSSNFIHQSNTDTNTTKFYSLLGHEDYIDELGDPRIKNAQSPHIVAKCVSNLKPKHFQDTDNHYTFYILATPNNVLFNPIEKYSPIVDKRQFDFIDKTCKNKWTFKQVSQITFSKYLSFLKTKNLSWLKEAERDLQ